jgi:flavodoxin I
MMSVNLVPDKYLIVYYSLSGNTKGVMNVIKNHLETEGEHFDVLPLQPKGVYEKVNIENYNHIFLGSPTYGGGETPEPVIEFLRYIIKYNNFRLPTFSVFGTGDTQWADYCKAVDEMEYHLSKKTKVTSKLKIEQYPISSHQIKKIDNFVELSIRR